MSTAVTTPRNRTTHNHDVDLSGWWRIVFRSTHWDGSPVDDANHPPATPESFCPPDRWQQTVFINLGLAAAHAADSASTGDRVWCNVADPVDAADSGNGVLVQISDQRQAPTSLGVTDTAAACRVSAIEAPTGFAVTAQIRYAAETQPEGDVCLMIASAPKPAARTPASARPELHGNWLALRFRQAGTFTAVPMPHPPASPA